MADDLPKTGILITFSEREVNYLIEALERLVPDGAEDEVIQSRLILRLIKALEA